MNNCYHVIGSLIKQDKCGLIVVIKYITVYVQDVDGDEEHQR